MAETPWKADEPLEISPWGSWLVSPAGSGRDPSMATVRREGTLLLKERASLLPNPSARAGGRTGLLESPSAGSDTKKKKKKSDLGQRGASEKETEG